MIRLGWVRYSLICEHIICKYVCMHILVQYHYINSNKSVSRVTLPADSPFKALEVAGCIRHIDSVRHSIILIAC